MNAAGGGGPSSRRDRFDTELRHALESLSRARVRLELGLARMRTGPEYRESLRETMIEVDDAARLVLSWMEDLHCTAPFDEESDAPLPAEMKALHSSIDD